MESDARIVNLNYGKGVLVMTNPVNVQSISTSIRPSNGDYVVLKMIFKGIPAYFKILGYTFTRGVKH